MTHEELLLFGERLYRRRNERKLTQDYVSNKIGITPRYYQMIERGEKCVSVKTLIAMSKALDISIDYLLFGDLSYDCSDPISDILAGLTPKQKDIALQMLKLYAQALD